MAVKIDGDGLVYIAGFAADSRNGPFSHSAHNCNIIIKAIKKATKQSKTIIYLTNSDPSVNFRHEVSEGYKRNRIKKCSKCDGIKFSPESHVERYPTANGIMKRRLYTCENCNGVVFDTKPVYYKRIRQYLIEKHNAIVVEWGECDDWLTTNSEDDWIATHDKDIYQATPGKFYNLKSKKLLKVNDPLGKLLMIKKPTPKILKSGKPAMRNELKGYGFKWFCAQMYLGDRIDNIVKPAKGDGPVFIYKMLDPLKTMKECWNMVKLYYKLTGNEDKLEEAAQLIWCARTPKQRGTIKTIEEFVRQ